MQTRQPAQAQELSAGLQDVRDLEVHRMLLDVAAASGNIQSIAGAFRRRGHRVSSFWHFQANTEAGARLLLTAST